MSTFKPSCAFRFVDRSKAVTPFRPTDFSSAVCSCASWACFATTQDIGFQEWSKHISTVMNQKENN